jgi:hypothetical protein
MPSRGPGKFSYDIDEALYGLTLDGGADEECSYPEGGGWYGLMWDGAELAEQIRKRRSKGEDEFVDVDDDELEMLRTDGRAGVVVFERSDGIVGVTYYISKADLEKDWEEVEKETAGVDEEDGFQENTSSGDLDDFEGFCGQASDRQLPHIYEKEKRAGRDDYARVARAELRKRGLEVPHVPSDDDEGLEERSRGGYARNSEEDSLRDETIEPFLAGKGPVFRIQTWETGRFDQHRLRRDRPMLGYRITMTEPGGQPEVVFEGEDYSPGAGTEPDSDQTLNDILAFFTNDYDDDSRTPRQREIVKKYDDYLSGFFEEREENTRRRNGMQPWIVTLGGEQTDIVYMQDGMDAAEVKRSLVDHDGYDPRISVKKRERRRTRAPDALASNARGRRRHA